MLASETPETGHKVADVGRIEAKSEIGFIFDLGDVAIDDLSVT